MKKLSSNKQRVKKELYYYMVVELGIFGYPWGYRGKR
jgi:hypothetical protein